MKFSVHGEIASPKMPLRRMKLSQPWRPELDNKSLLLKALDVVAIQHKNQYRTEPEALFLDAGIHNTR